MTNHCLDHIVSVNKMVRTGSFSPSGEGDAKLCNNHVDGGRIMKIFIWEDVLRDYTAGMAMAYAETCEDALGMFESHVAENLGAPTKVIDCNEDKEAYAAYVYGGG